MRFSRFRSRSAQRLAPRRLARRLRAHALLSALLLAAIALPLAACEDFEESETGLQYRDEKVGDGAVAEAGQWVTVHYTGTLESDGTKFDSSRDRGQPFTFHLGRGEVIPGWDEGVAGMQVGGERTLVIPPELGYGQRATGKIPANSALRFEVELLNVQDPPQQWSIEDAAKRTAPGGLVYYVIEEGEGDRPQKGQQVQVHYSGYLQDGTMFDSSKRRGQPFEFPLGAGRVIPGWDQGVALMRPGARYQFLIPPGLAYGDRGAGRVIPPNATLVFDIELIGAQ